MVMSLAARLQTLSEGAVLAGIAKNSSATQQQLDICAGSPRLPPKRVIVFFFIFFAHLLPLVF
jgi:hypothetical protein